MKNLFTFLDVIFRPNNIRQTLGRGLIQTKLLTILLLVIGSIAYGQSPKIVPVSPEASALAKMVNYPVSLNTGLPDISIPLYKIESGGMTLPIALNYHAGGFKINERSTSVGLGWSLSCDLQITRTINGLDDIAGSPTGGIGYLANSKMKASNYPLYDGSSSAYDIAAGLVDGMPDKFNYKLLNKSGSFYFQKDDSGGYTIIPVPFDNIKISYNSANSVFIIIDTDGTIYTFGGPIAREYAGDYSNPNINTTAWKCALITNATNTETISFTYQDKSTIKNVNSQDRIEYYNNPTPCSLYSVGGTPYCRSIQTSSSTNTSFEVLTQSHPFFMLSSPKWMEYFAGVPQGLFHWPDLNAQNQVVDKTFTVNSGSGSSVSTSTGLALSTISFRGGSVVFYGTDQLNSISIQDAGGSEIRSFYFSQSNALPADLTGAQAVNGVSFNGTSYLDEIQVKSNGSVFEKYVLQYQDKYCFGSHLSGTDAWGYPNDYTTDNSYTSDPANYCNTCDPANWRGGRSTTNVPHQQIIQRFQKDVDQMANGCTNYVDNVAFNIGNSSNTEMPSHYGAQHGILKRISYPTGGYVDFDFESNMYKQEVWGDAEAQVVRMGGGLRIRSINYYDGKSYLPVSQKYYRYGEMEDGIGLLINTPDRNFNDSRYEYDPFSYSQMISYLSATSSNCTNRDCMILDFSEKKTTYLPASSLSNTYSTGAPIYYTKVTEYNSDLGLNTGKKVHNFYTPNYFSQYFGAKIWGTNIDMLQTDGLMGQEKSLMEYKYEQGKYSLTHSLEFNYTKYNRPERVNFVYSYFNVIYQVLGDNFTGSTQDLYHNNSGSYSTSDIMAGEYGIEVGKLLLSSETEKWYKNASNSGWNYISQQTQYSYDNNGYMQPSQIVTTNSKGQTLTKSIKYAYDFTDAVSTQMTANNMISQPIEETVVNTTLNKEISRTKTNYGSISVTSGPTFIAPVSVEQSIGGNAADILMTYDKYDLYANILQTTGKDKLPTSYLWGYNHKYLIAEVKGMPYSVVASASDVGESTLLSLTDNGQINTSLNTLRANLPGTFVNSFTHKPLIGLLSQTNPAGKISYYEYDSFGRLKVIRDQSNNIVKKYDYQMLNSTSMWSGTSSYANIPTMETLYGTLYDGSAASLSNNKIYNSVSGSPDYSGAYTASSNDVIITLFRWCPSYLPTPGLVHLDLIDDESIVFSKPFSAVDVSPPVAVTFHVPPGAYKINFRHEDNFQGSAVKYDFGEVSGSGDSYIKSGDTLNLLPGKSYWITMTNDWY